MGEDKTPSPFRKACDIFTELELLLEDNTMDKDEREEKELHLQGQGKEQKKTRTAPSKEQIEEAVVKIITENQMCIRDRCTGSERAAEDD